MRKSISPGIELWEKAKRFIPGGNQLLSKRSERFLPGLWPSYYAKAKGCEVWCIDGNHFYDFAQMGVGCCTLGYADNEVNHAVTEAVHSGTMCTLNCYEEVMLAEKLIELHPWADMARFTRSGGEACALAVRIARAATGRDKIAFCGYHGWHDWYLSANLQDKNNLDEQLLAGLMPLGVPQALYNTALPFRYNCIDDLERIVEHHGSEIGAIIMEPQRSASPKKQFLSRVKKISEKIGAVLIFDEITTGFRMNLGGIHMVHGMLPDMAVFGKALGNGYSISAVIGKRNVMDSAQDSFISSTAWTERIGFVAALKTLEKMKDLNVQEKLIYCGERINAGWKSISKENDIKLTISGIPPLTHLSFDHKESLALHTLYAQEMLERGYLLGQSIYTTYAYTDDIIDRFLLDSGKVFKKLKTALEISDIKRFLKGRVIVPGFERLN